MEFIARIKYRLYDARNEKYKLAFGILGKYYYTLYRLLF